MSLELNYALYRYFDATGRLLYIGESGILPARETQHIARSRWMPFAASSTIERYPTAEKLKAAERQAIRAERPLFNIRHNPAGCKERLRAYLDEIGRLDLLPSERARKPAVNKPVEVTPRTRGITLGPGVTPEMAARLDMFDIFSDPQQPEELRAEAFGAYLRLGNAA